MASPGMLERLLLNGDGMAAAWRRQRWLLDNFSLGKAWNLALCANQFLLKRDAGRAWPVALKIDISPLCNLRCTMCIHARPGEGDDELAAQSFRRGQMMSLDQFRRIVGEVKGRTAAISMYYFGDPLMHPELDAMCAAAAEAGLNTHVSTNLSFRLGRERIRSLVASGLTHLTVCVDGLSQETYERTRVGGRIALVLENVKAVMAERERLGRRFPRVEVQFIKFQHNVHELDEARRLLASFGVDQFTSFWGSLARAWHASPDAHGATAPKKPRTVPLCYWPHFFMQIKYNGDVIPCCTYRQTAQYGGGDARPVGNVFESSVGEVWNSPAYRRLRRQVSDPLRFSRERDAEQSFCDGCERIFETDRVELRPFGDSSRWEDHYRLDERGRVVPSEPAYERSRRALEAADGGAAVSRPPLADRRRS